MVQSCKTFQSPVLHMPSWGRPRGLYPLVPALIRRWPESRASRGSAECKKLGFWVPWNRIWISTLAALSGAASGKSLTTSQPHFFFCKIKSPEMSVFRMIIYMRCVCISLRSCESVFTNSVFEVTWEKISAADEDRLYLVYVLCYLSKVWTLEYHYLKGFG